MVNRKGRTEVLSPVRQFPAVKNCPYILCCISKCHRFPFPPRWHFDPCAPDFGNVDTERLPSRTKGNQRAAVLERVVKITRNVRKSLIGIYSYSTCYVLWKQKCHSSR